MQQSPTVLCLVLNSVFFCVHPSIVLSSQRWLGSRVSADVNISSLHVAHISSISSLV